MFPGMYRSPDDPNRRLRSDGASDPADGSWPPVLRWGYWVCVAAAIFMTFSGLVMFALPVEDRAGAAPEVIEAFHRNVRFVAIFNVVAGVLVAALAAQLKSAGLVSRRVLIVVIALAVFCNVAAFAIQVGGLAMIVIVILLAVAAFLVFRPASNRYFARANGRNY
ncbi:hypothetical protein CATRI_01640 [Corynebacterium atrinae]|uniref:hypothetical protein n=1 Tax=Corynebacterium atrinae TaxID=1336740 RepID=UPI0025B435C2|nr:hypothetical protein [Corynebacterium atrinae]WJY62437.1 hypothetical protein CATRI_01640 [Corynebacterium atrinae]